MQTQNKQKGFTLIEIAIVLVIIGLLLGGVLKGQELIKSAKVKAAAGDVNAYSVALIGYQDRYGDLFSNGEDSANKYLVTGDLTTGAANITSNSTIMLNELIGRGLIASKAQHALGGNIVLIKNGNDSGTLGSNNLARNDSTNPATFSWAVCYTDISNPEDAEGLVRAIDGSDVTFPAAYRTGRARLVTNGTYASSDALDHEPATSDTICFEI